MENEAAKKFATGYQQAGRSAIRRINADILVPIGVTLTVGCYLTGLKSLANSQFKLGQKMMYCRIAFQGMTFAAMFYEKFTAQTPR